MAGKNECITIIFRVIVTVIFFWCIGCALFELPTEELSLVLVQPADGDTIVAPITIEAFVENAKIETVEFFVDDSLIGVDENYPYAAIWNADDYLRNQWYQIYARATDINDNTGKTEPVNVFLKSNIDLPQLIRPDWYEIVPADSIIFEWKAVDGADEYRLEIATDENFTQMVKSIDTAATRLTTNLLKGYYFWRARAQNSAGLVSAWSTTRIVNPGTYTLIHLPGLSYVSDVAHDDAGNTYFTYWRGSAPKTAIVKINNEIIVTGDYEFDLRTDGIDLLGNGQIALAGTVNNPRPDRWNDVAAVAISDIYGHQSNFNSLDLDGWGEGNDCIGTPDGGVIVIGEYNNWDNNQEDMLVWKLDTNWETEWYRLFGGSENDEGIDILPAQDGGYICLGINRSHNPGSDSYWIVKIDSLGYEQNETILGIKNDYPDPVICESNGDFVVTGEIENAGSDELGIYTLDSDGELLSINHVSYDHIRFMDMAVTLEGKYLLTGGVFNPDTDEYDIFVFLLDQNGQVDWEIVAGGYGSEAGVSIKVMPDNSAIIYAETGSYPQYGNLQILHISADGEMLE